MLQYYIIFSTTSVSQLSSLILFTNFGDVLKFIKRKREREITYEFAIDY